MVGTQLIQSMFLPLLVGLFAAEPQGSQVVPCSEFYEALEAVPHVALEQRIGSVESTWDGDVFEGCEVAFETNDSALAGADTPDFVPDPDTGLYRAGWRSIPEIGADGAGSGIHGIRRGLTECLVRWDQPAFIDDDGSLVESDTLTMLIQCRGPRAT